MKAISHVTLRSRRNIRQKAGRPVRVLGWLGFGAALSLIWLAVAFGIAYALFSQSFPSLDLVAARYGTRPAPTAFYARDGETLLFTLAYDNFDSRDLKICDSDGEGCFPERFLTAARITRENAVRQGTKKPLAFEMVNEVYGDYIASSRFPRLTEGLLSLQVSHYFGEKTLREWYYNSAWFGQMAFGLDAAARLYLDKGGDQLSDAECVLLSAVINAPMLNPIDSNGAVRDSYLRQLSMLVNAGLFSAGEAEVLSRTNFTIFEPPAYAGHAIPDLLTRKALDAAVNLYGKERVERGGLRIITTEDAELQRYLNCTAMPDPDDAEGFSACPLSGDRSESEIQSALTVLRTAPVSAALLEVNTGQILAEIETLPAPDGSGVDVVPLRAYPVGSSMNYFAALTAFTNGDAPSTLLWDLPEDGGAVDGSYLGPVQLRQALTEDAQRPLDSHMKAFGSSLARTAALFGLNSSGPDNEDTLLTNGGSYSAESFAFSLIPFAAMGDQTGTDFSGAVRPASILRVEKENGETVFPQASVRKPLIAPNLAYLVHHVFSRDPLSFSPVDRPSAVKVGHSAADDGVWISGYTTQISCALRVGTPRTVSAFVSDAAGNQQTAEMLWRSLMDFAHRDLAPAGWDVPEGISHVRICLPSGKLPASACQETMTDIFLQGNEPYEYDEYYVEVPVNKNNRMLATRFTKPEDIEDHVFLNLPDEASAWASAAGIESMPVEYDPIRGDEQTPGITIESPAAFETYTMSEEKTLDVILRLELPEQPGSFQVSIGKGMYPDSWREVCSGKGMENGQWLLCSIPGEDLEPGLYVLRTAFTLNNNSYRSAETYFEIE